MRERRYKTAEVVSVCLAVVCYGVDMISFRSPPPTPKFLAIKPSFRDFQEVSESVRLHVNAKRYLCAARPGYWETLSPASKRSLEAPSLPLHPVCTKP